ncbi:MAG: DUF4160 domain-containing protein [Desulfovibrio sp.]|jgi:hypothetical protein|nr:DUF4160 domain-containing protein [Desulfovibrio sp.]
MFFGIIIYMCYDEHNSPHFHAKYGEQMAMFTFDGDLIQGDFPEEKLRFVKAWALLRKDELAANWEIAKEGAELYRIDPIK